MLLGLTAEQLAERRKGLGGTDAKRIIEGDWVALWREKMGLTEPVDLSGNLPVQLGSFTEAFNCFWYEKTSGRAVIRRNETWVSEQHPFMRANLDGLTNNSAGMLSYIDFKHVGQFRYEELVERYTPQLTHNCIVCEADYWVLSVLAGNSRHEVIEGQPDPFFAQDLIEQEADFWTWVEAGEEPPDMSPQPIPKPQPRLRTVEMDQPFGSPEWQAFVARNNWAVDCANAIEAFAETEAAHKAYGAARTTIGSLLPEDVGKLVRPTKRGLFTAKRSTTGALTMTIKQENA
jgi:hypothetical protein